MLSEQGYIDVSIGFGGVDVDGYDITASGDCGTYHFQGSVAPPSGNIQEVAEELVDKKGIVTNIVNENLQGRN